jgi:hypothetical protein
MTRIEQRSHPALSDPCSVGDPRLPFFPRFSALLRRPAVMHDAEKNVWVWLSPQVLAAQ